MFRVLSQNGNVDVPYEILCFALNETKIGANFTIVAYSEGAMPNVYVVLGEYSTSERALKVMQMLRKAYINYLYPSMRKYKNDSNITTTADEIDKYHYDINYFQFPMQDEIGDIK